MSLPPCLTLTSILQVELLHVKSFGFMFFSLTNRNCCYLDLFPTDPPSSANPKSPSSSESSSSDDSFEAKMDEAIAQGKGDVAEGKEILGEVAGGAGGTKRDIETRSEEVCFDSDSEFRGILSQLSKEVQDEILKHPNESDRCAALNTFLNGLIKELPIVHQAIVIGKWSNIDKFAALKKFYEMKAETSKRSKTS